MLRRLVFRAAPLFRQEVSVAVAVPSTSARWFHTFTQRALSSKKFDPSAATGTMSHRVHPTSARTRRQQHRQQRQQQDLQQQRRTSTSGETSQGSTSTRTNPSAHQTSSKASRSDAPDPTQERRQSARGKQTIGRFNRITAEKGLGFASYLYVVGESVTLGVTYLLHTDRLHTGETGSWLTALGAGGFVDGYLERGPSVFGVRLSPRLLLNYLVANLCTYPLYRYQYAFCLATAPLLGKATAPLRRRLRESRKTKAIPKAPSAEPTR